jgi:hypothetical protein
MQEILPSAPGAVGGVAKYGGTAAKRHVADAALRGLRLVGLQHEASPNYLIEARMSSSDAGAPRRCTVLEAILAAEAVRGHDHLEISCLPNSRALGLIAGEKFLKIALNAGALSRLERHAASTARLQRHPIGQHVPLPAQLREAAGVHYLACPAVQLTAASRATAAQMGEVLDVLDSRATRMKLCETVLWERLFDPETRSGLEVNGWASVLEHIEATCAERTVRTGLIHGDLHGGNVLRGANGSLVVIDWDLSEERAPLFLDAIEAVKALVSSGGGHLASFVPDLELILAGAPTLPLRKRVFGRDDELSAPEMVVCYLLWHAARSVWFFGPQLPAAERVGYAAWVPFAEGMLGLPTALHIGAGATP